MVAEHVVNASLVNKSSAGSQVGQAVCTCSHVPKNLSTLAAQWRYLWFRVCWVSVEGQYFHPTEITQISSTLRLRNGCSGLRLAIQCRAILLFNHSCKDSGRGCLDKRAKSSAASTAAFNSSLGRVSCLSRAALTYDMTSDGMPLSC